MTAKKKVLVKKMATYITLAIMTVVSLFPILFGISASFRTQRDLFEHMFPFTVRSLIPTQFTFENYVDIFTEYNFGKPILNTLIITFVTVLLGCVLSSVCGFVFAFFEFKGKRLLYALVMFSFMIPFEGIAIPLYKVAVNLGLGDTHAAVILPVAADGLIVFLFVQFFKDIPSALIEAARIDGAKWRTIFLKVLMPLSLPVFISAGLLLFMSQWNSYMWPLLISRTEETRTIQMAIGRFSGEASVKWTYIYAGSMLSGIIPISLFLPFQKYFVAGITAGSVKG